MEDKRQWKSKKPRCYNLGKSGEQEWVLDIGQRVAKTGEVVVQCCVED